eukprot:3569560-Rhodomonas_salina.3
MTLVAPLSTRRGSRRGRGRTVSLISVGLSDMNRAPACCVKSNTVSKAGIPAAGAAQQAATTGSTSAGHLPARA